MLYQVVCELFVGAESVALNDAVYAFDVDERVGANLVKFLVPKKLLGFDDFFLGVAYAYVAVQLPKFLVLVVSGEVAPDSGFDLEIVVEFLKEQALGKFPIRLARFIVDNPFGGGDAIASHSGVADERFYIAGVHSAYAVAI